MPTTLTAPPPGALPIDPPRKLWTRVQCEELEKAGLLDQQHLELIEGELINRMGKKRPHVNALAYLVGWLASIFGKEFVLQEAPIDVAPQDNPTSEPEPDAIVLKKPYHQFASSNPGPDDLKLVVEVSDSSLYFDITKKAALYARAAISEYWVLDVTGHRLFVHLDPHEGKYQSVKEYNEQESVSPLSAPGAHFLVGSAFL